MSGEGGTAGTVPRGKGTFTAEPESKGKREGGGGRPGPGSGRNRGYRWGGSLDPIKADPGADRDVRLVRPGDRGDEPKILLLVQFDGDHRVGARIVDSLHRRALVQKNLHIN